MEVDYIIVGAGSAGCVLANRLSENPQNRVLLIEAGGKDRSLWITMPIGYGRLFNDSRVNWRYEAEPDVGIDGRRAYWPRGKVLGGSSSINAMVCLRGRNEDYEDWATATGEARWGSASMARAFRAIDGNDRGSDTWRNDAGPMPLTSISDAAHPLSDTFIQGCNELGLEFNPDFNGESQEGVGLYQINTRNGKRVSAATAFLRPVMRRPNLDVMLETQVLKLTFDGMRCNGLIAERGGKQHILTARREVIVAAGAVESPKLLQLSGIGNADTLAEHGIAVRLNNPNVGANLQDHVGLNYYYRSTIPTLNQELSPLLRRFWNGMKYVLARSGPLAMSVNQGGGFFRTSPDKALPNMQLYLQVITTLQARNLNRPLMAPDPFPAFGLGLSNVRPKSRGTIDIASADPYAAPLIRPNTYSAEEDVQEMVEAVRFMRRLAATAPMSAVIDAELQPGPEIASEEDLIRDIRQRTGTVFHPSCTCAMGKAPDSSVLDPDLKVWGTEGLRVVDASSFPNIVSGNLNLPVMMLAERASDLIT